MNFLEIIEKADASRLGFILLHLRRVIKITGGFGGGAVWGSPLKATGRGAECPPFLSLALFSMWLFHLHSAVKIQPFSPVFPLAGATDKVFYTMAAEDWSSMAAGATDKAFYRLSLWSFKEKSINHFL
ncbi:hypothetical protein [Bilophila sp.]|uniref:hypothetical protein n=1 Tax=Bilophila sp. TaxID=1929485 RepID=UPI003077C296